MFSNYSVKKILPRLIIVAIAVNLSFYICAALVDLSNIIGVNVKDLIAGMGGGSVNLGIAGNIIAVIGIIIALIVGGTGALIAALLIFLCLVLRNVVLTALIIVSPVAFVLYLLPNTEKWAKKWLTEFTRMLFVFPMIAAVMGICMFLISVIDSGGAAASSQSGVVNAANNFILFVSKILLLIAPAIALMPIMKFGGQAMGMIAKGANAAADKSGVSKWSKEKDAMRRKSAQAGQLGTNSRMGRWLTGNGRRTLGVNTIGRGMAARSRARQIRGQVYDRRIAENTASYLENSNDPAMAAMAASEIARAQEEEVAGAQQRQAAGNVDDNDLMSIATSQNSHASERVAALRNLSPRLNASQVQQLITGGALSGLNGTALSQARSALAGSSGVQRMGRSVADAINRGNLESTNADERTSAFNETMSQALQEINEHNINSSELDVDTLGTMIRGAARATNGQQSLDHIRGVRDRANASANFANVAPDKSELISRATTRQQPTNTAEGGP